MKRNKFLLWLAAGLPIAALGRKRLLAALTREQGEVTSISPDTVAITGNPTQYQVSGGIPAPSNVVGSQVSFDIELSEREPIATNVLPTSPPPSGGGGDAGAGDGGDAAGGDGGDGASGD